MLVVALGTLVVPFDSSVNFAFPFITRAFGLPIPAIQWVVIAYTLTYAALMLVFGRVGDMLGYRRIFLAGSAVECGRVRARARWRRRYGALLAARVLQGVGAALVLSCGPALATSLYPEQSRTRVLGIYTMVDRHRRRAGTVDRRPAGAADRLAGGVLVPRTACTCRVPALAGCCRADARRRTPRDASTRWVALLLVLAISAMLLALNQLQHIGEPAWFSAGGACVRRSRPPASSCRSAARRGRSSTCGYFRDFDFSLLNAGHAALSLAGFSVLLLVPFYLSRFGGLTAHATGLLLACSPAGTVLAAPLAARLATRVPPRLLALLGAAGMAIGQVLIGIGRCDAEYPGAGRRDGVAGVRRRAVPGGVFRYRHRIDPARPIAASPAAS